MITLLLILLVVLISIILYMLRDRKLKQQHEWYVWTSRSSSFPPPPTGATLQVAVGSHNPVTFPHHSGSSALNKEPEENFRENEIIHQPMPGYIIQAANASGAQNFVTNLSARQNQETSSLRQKKEKDNTQDIPITSMNKQQLDDYLQKNPGRYQNNSTAGVSNGTTMVYSEALRLASLDPEEVVYINENQWFHPTACESYPSQTTVGEELLMTIKGSWILKKPGINQPSACTYQVVSKKDAFIFLESNGFSDTAASIAPHNPSCEL